MEQSKKRLQKSGISEAFRQKKVNNFDIKDKHESIINARNKAIEYITGFEEIRNSKQNSIILSGQPGSGKTHLCMAISNKFLDDGIPTFYMSYRDDMPKIKKSMCDDETFGKMLGKYKDVEVLYIDDLFKGKITESDTNIIFELVNHRYLKQLPIIISTELTTEALIDIDEAVGSRIVEMAKNFTVEIPLDKKLNYRLMS